MITSRRTGSSPVPPDARTYPISLRRAATAPAEPGAGAAGRAERRHQLGGARRAGVIAGRVLALEQLLEQREVLGLERRRGVDRGLVARARALLVVHHHHGHVAERLEQAQPLARLVG